MILLALLSGCGGGHSSGPSASGPTPAIANLRTTLQPRTCTVSGLTGSRLDVAFDYADADGDLNGGTAETTTTFLTSTNRPVGDQFNRNFPIVTAEGTRAGTLSSAVCVRFGILSSKLRLDVAVIDRAGHSSNVLSAEVQAGDAPLVPRSGAELMK
jgi:hypothetical protein